MTTNPNTQEKEQYNKSHINDENENTSDDSLLLTTDVFHEKQPLLNMNENDIPLRLRSKTIHCHVPDNRFDYNARNRIIIVLILCIIFMIIEIVGGILSNSTAIITDATHMCIDALGFFISLIAISLARKRPTKRFSFGYTRAEVLGALLSVLTIWLATGILVYMAILRCIDQSFTVKPVEMIIVASCGVIFNIVMFFVLHSNTFGQSVSHHGHSHNHHSHSTELLVVDIVSSPNHEHLSKPTKNINVQAAMIHVIGDFVQSIGVLIAAILIKFKPECKLADPICTFIFSILVLITTITIMKDIVLVLMEGVPSNVNYRQILRDLLQLPGVRNAHNLHIWSLSLQKTALSVHLAIDDEQNSLKILNEAQEMLRHEHSINQTTIQIESYDEQIMSSCENCRQLDC